MFHIYGVVIVDFRKICKIIMAVEVVTVEF